MENSSIKEEVVRLKTNLMRARYNLMFMIILSVINVFAVYFKGSVLLPFSFAISTYAISFGTTIYNETQSASFLIIGIFISVLLLSILVICYFNSKKNILFLVAPLGIVAVDTIALLVFFIAISGMNSLTFIDLIMHVMTIVYFISGLKAYKALGDLNQIEDKAFLDMTSSNEVNKDAYSDQNCQQYEEYNDDGAKSLLSGKFKGLQILVVAHEDKAELIVNGYVCDALNPSYMSEYSLTAVVNGIDILFQYEQSYDGERMYLYADDQLLDSVVKE